MKKIIFIRNLIIVVYPILFIFLFYKFPFLRDILDRLIKNFQDKANALILFIFLFIFIPEIVVLLSTNYFFRD